MIETDIADLLQQHRAIAGNRFRWPWQTDPNSFADEIDELVHVLCGGDALAADDIASHISEAGKQIVGRTELGFGSAQRNLQDWQGDAADNFAGYLLQVKAAIGHYHDVFHDFYAIQRGCVALIQEAHKKTRELLDKAVQAQQEQSASDANFWNVTLAVGAAVAGVVSTALSGGGALAGWAIVASGVAGGASTASAIISTSGPGDTAQSLRDGLRTLLNQVIDQREELYGAVGQLDQYISDSVDNKHLAEVQPPPPLILTRPNFKPETFGLGDEEPPGVDGRVAQDPLVKPNRPGTSPISARLAGTL